MNMKENTHEELQQQLEKAIDSGNTALAEELVAVLYANEEQKEIEMPQDFPNIIMAKATKGSSDNMNKRKMTKKMVASVAAFAIVLSFGVTAYANGWIGKTISVFEDRNIIATGDNINETNVDDALKADYAKDYSDTVRTTAKDFAAGCEAAKLPIVYPTYLDNHSEFKLEGRVEIQTNPKYNTQSVSGNYFSDKQYICIQLAYDENQDDILAAFDDNMKVENQRTVTTTAGDTFTTYDVAYVEKLDSDPDNKLVTSIISINNYLVDITTDNMSDSEIQEVLNSVDLSILK